MVPVYSLAVLLVSAVSVSAQAFAHGNCTAALRRDLRDTETRVEFSDASGVRRAQFRGNLAVGQTVTLDVTGSDLDLSVTPRNKAQGYFEVTYGNQLQPNGTVTESTSSGQVREVRGTYRIVC